MQIKNQILEDKLKRSSMCSGSKLTARHHAETAVYKLESQQDVGQSRQGEQKIQMQNTIMKRLDQQEKQRDIDSQGLTTRAEKRRVLTDIDRNKGSNSTVAREGHAVNLIGSTEVNVQSLEVNRTPDGDNIEVIDSAEESARNVIKVEYTAKRISESQALITGFLGKPLKSKPVPVIVMMGCNTLGVIWNDQRCRGLHR